MSFLDNLLENHKDTTTSAPKTNTAESVNVEDVNQAKAALEADTTVELVGVNAPEFDEYLDEIDLMDDAPISLEETFEEQASTTTPLTVPTHDDGLDDDPEPLTTSHLTYDELMSESTDLDQDTNTTELEGATDTMTTNTTTNVPVEIDEETLPWNKKPFGSRYFNFGGRTVNAFARADLKCFDEIKGWAYSELKALKGFGQGCLDEVLEYLEEENATDWLVKRKKKNSSATTDASVSEDSYSDVSEATIEAADPIVEEPVESAPAVEVEESVVAASSDSDSASAPTSNESDAPSTSSATPTNSFKVLVVGSAYVNNPAVLSVSFEQVYGEVIRQICEHANTPSLSMIEYGKGWGALATAIRQNGWPRGVDVLCVSQAFLSRPEVLMELRLLADVVIGG